jgi:Fe-S protein assembly chaperone HscA
VPVSIDPKAKDPIIGIDLGTTNSLVAHVLNGIPTVLKTREGENLLPSVITFGQGKNSIGYAAKANKAKKSKDTIFSVKRLLGRKLEDIDTQTLPYSATTVDGEIRINVGNRSLSPIEVSAMILAELKLSAERALNTPVHRAVITVPAYFNDSQRQATRAAGRIAGLDVLRIINEPTAAALAYGLGQKKEGLIAVYDLGGGTFDISILKLHDGVFEVLATNGNTMLGGDDIDQAIVQDFIASTKAKVDSSEEYAVVLEAAEKAKIELSVKGETRIQFKNYDYKLNRDSFKKLVQPLLDQTREPSKKALEDAGVNPEQLSDVILVGGPTRLEVVQNTVKDIFGKNPSTSVHPEEAVAIGAAIQADILAGNNKDVLLLDVLPLSLGMETYGGIMSVLIPRNTKIPAVAREQFTTFVDRQTAVDIHILQGERDRVETNRSLAKFKLRGIQPAYAGQPRIAVTFLVDADGILQVSAQDMKTGAEQSIEVKPSYGLTDQEIERMILEGATYAEADIEFKKLAEVKNEFEPALRAAETKFTDAKRLLTDEEVREIQKSIENAKAAFLGSDIERIREAGLRLNHSTEKLANLILKEALK